MDTNTLTLVDFSIVLTLKMKSGEIKTLNDAYNFASSTVIYSHILRANVNAIYTRISTKLL